jgi:ABC-type lipoprotein release transport system permease subunit
LIRPRAIVVVALSMLIFTATASVLSGLRSAPEAFAASEGFVISDNTAPTIFSSRVGVDMAYSLERIPSITGASPEVFAFSSYEDVSFVVRGVELDKFNKTGPTFKEFSLAQRQSMAYPNCALVGYRLLERLDIDLPFTLPLVGSYSSKMEFVDVVGSYTTGSPLDDEMLVSLDVARFLSGMPTDKVSIVRVATDNPDWLAGVLSPENSRFTLFDLHTSKGEVAVGESLSISVGVRNWGGSAGEITVLFSEGVRLLDEAVVSLDASGFTTVTRSIQSEQLGDRSIEVSIHGDFPVTLYANFTVIEPYLTVSAPSKVLLGSSFNVSVTKSCGEPAEGSLVTFGTQSVYADTSGTASLSASAAGTWTVRATMSGLTEASAAVQVQDPSAFPAEFLPTIVDFTVLPEVVKESESARGVLAVTNSGSLGGQFIAQILVDTQIFTTLNISLPGMSSETVRFDISGLAPGTHTVQAGSFSRSLVVESWIAENPDLVQLVVRYGGSTTLSSSATIPIYQAAKISEGNVSVALFAIGATSALLAALAIASIYSKEVHESRRTLGILRTIGASKRAIRRLIFPQALRSGLAGAAVGIVLGVLVVDSMSRSGLFMVFGHTLALELDLWLLLMVLLASVVISVGTALWCSMAASRESAIVSIRGLENDGQAAAAEEPEDG